MFAVLPEELIETGNISQETLIMIIMLPVIATILGFTRHVIGIKSLGLYAPIILTYAFLELGLSSSDTTWEGKALYGLKYGLILTIVVFIVSFITNIITKKMRLHYFPKIALVLSTVALSIYLLLVLANAVDKYGLLHIGFLPVILISTVSEQFVSIMAKKNLQTALSLAITTVVISAGIFIITIFEPFQRLLIEQPYLLLVTIILNILIGKFTGLRALEYLRFRDILEQD